VLSLCNRRRADATQQCSQLVDLSFMTITFRQDAMLRVFVQLHTHNFRLLSSRRPASRNQGSDASVEIAAVVRSFSGMSQTGTGGVESEGCRP
jgi:hypothetical protein